MRLELIRNGDYIIDPIYENITQVYEIIDKKRLILRDQSGESFYGSLESRQYAGPKAEVDRLIRLIDLCFRVYRQLRKLRFYNFNAQTIAIKLCKDADKIISAQRQREYEDGLCGPKQETTNEE